MRRILLANTKYYKKHDRRRIDLYVVLLQLVILSFGDYRSRAKITKGTMTLWEDPIQRKIQSWIRAFHIFCNFLLALLGKGGIAVCTLCKINISGDLILLDHYQNVNVNVFCGCSIALTVIGWLGIFAGLKNSHKLTFVNGLMLGGFLLSTTCYVVIMIIITDYTQTGDLYKQMRREMNDYDRNSKIINLLQTTLSCCGLNDIAIWNTRNIPKSCCQNSGQKFQIECYLGSPYLHNSGCIKEFIRILRYYSWLLFAIFIFSGFLEIFGIILSYLQCCIINHMMKKKIAKRNLLKIPRPQISVAEC